KRKGGGSSGGGGGKGGSSSSSGGKGVSSSGSTGKGGSSSSGSGSGIGKSSPIKSSSTSIGGSTKSVSTYSKGGGKISTIPSGALFAGRTQGGASRGQIWGTRSYGSGYPGSYSRGVGGRGFPFYFWPVVWGGGIGYGANAAYLHSGEYGAPDNTSRPGGPMAFAVFQSNATINGTTFRLVSDNNTVSDLMPAIATNCSQFLTPAGISATLPTPFVNTSSLPEEVVQYYRASSVSLNLDGYNNTAVFAAENATADTPLPSGIDTNLLDCLNYTIGQAVPLVDGARSMASPPNLPFIGLGLLLLLVLK
ncbi:hypothetical protein DFH06DRAFT_930790, partial [Mycena polygramma]